MKVLVLGGKSAVTQDLINTLSGQNHEIEVFEDKKRIKTKKFDGIIDLISSQKEEAEFMLKTFPETSHYIFTSNKFTTIETYLLKQMIHFPITIVKPSTVYGVGIENIGVLKQNYNIIDRLKQNKPLIMFGDGKAPYNFIFSKDLANIYVGLLGKKEAIGEIIHATNELHYCWGDLYKEIGKLLNIEPKIMYMPTELLVKANPELFTYLKEEYMDYPINKLKTILNDFTPTSLNDGLKPIIEWLVSDNHYIDQDKDYLEDQLSHLYEKLSIEMVNVHKKSILNLK